MASRMERYYQSENNTNRRTKRNESLYDQMYDSKVYNNVDTLASLDAGKEIDISELKAMLEKRNEDSRLRIVKPVEPYKQIVSDLYDEKSYDLNDMIDKAKKDQPISDKRRSLEETQVLTLQELVKGKEYANKGKINKSEMNDLINTIYNTNLLKKDDGGGLFDDLKSTGNTVVTTSIKEVLENKKQPEENDEIDKSFYTSSLGFKQSDFEDLEELNKNVEKSNKATTIFLIIFGLLFAAGVAYILFRYGIIKGI